MGARMRETNSLLRVRSAFPSSHRYAAIRSSPVVDKGRSPAEYGASLKFAINHGWLWTHESATSVACAGVSLAIGGNTPKASAASITMSFGCGARPVREAFGMKSSGSARRTDLSLLSACFAGRVFGRLLGWQIAKKCSGHRGRVIRS
jgi:hypothetical protein